MFDIKTVGGYRESATDPNGHPAGLAADFMVPAHPRRQGPGRRAAWRTPRPTPASSASTTSSGTSGSGRSPAPTRAGGRWRTAAATPRTTSTTRTSTCCPTARWPVRGTARERRLRRGRLPGPGAVHRQRPPQLARDRRLLVDVAHRHRLLRPLRDPGLRRPRRHHRDRHHPGLGRPVAGQGHHRPRVADHLVRPHGEASPSAAARPSRPASRSARSARRATATAATCTSRSTWRTARSTAPTTSTPPSGSPNTLTAPQAPA